MIELLGQLNNPLNITILLLISILGSRIFAMQSLARLWGDPYSGGWVRKFWPQYLTSVVLKACSGFQYFLVSLRAQMARSNLNLDWFVVSRLAMTQRLGRLTRPRNLWPQISHWTLIVQSNFDVRCTKYYARHLEKGMELYER